MADFEKAQDGWLEPYPEWMVRAFMSRDNHFPIRLMRTWELRFDEIAKKLGLTIIPGEMGNNN